MLHDDDIKMLLMELDEDEDTDVTDWEANFLENVVYNHIGPLTAKQREAALNMLEKYGYEC